VDIKFAVPNVWEPRKLKQMMRRFLWLWQVQPVLHVEVQGNVVLRVQDSCGLAQVRNVEAAVAGVKTKDLFYQLTTPSLVPTAA
jgi:hypothetical protein